MKSSLEKLQKFFRLEAGRNYDNRAVMGGLESMLKQWEAEAHAEELPEDLVQAISTRLRDYGRLSPDSRSEALKGLWKRVQRETDTKSEIMESEPAKSKKGRAPQKGKDSATKSKHSRSPKQTKTKEKPKRRKYRPKPDGPPASLDASVTVLDGVGPKNAEKFARLGINSLGDMLYHFPRRYDDYTQLKPINRLEYSEVVTVIGSVQSISTRPLGGKKKKLAEVIISDGSGALRINWFNQPWITKSLEEDTQIVVSGRIEQYLGRLIMNNPEWELLSTYISFASAP